VKGKMKQNPPDKNYERVGDVTYNFQMADYKITAM
jgi:hypothetical protein